MNQKVSDMSDSLEECPMENIFTSRKSTQFENNGEWIVPFGSRKGIRISKVSTEYIKHCLEKFEDFRYGEEFKSELMRRYKKK